MALTRTWGDVEQRILLDLRDPRRTNLSFAAPRLMDMANRSLELISEEVAKWNQDFGVSTLRFELESPNYQATLPDGFLDFSTKRRLPRIYVVVNSNQSPLYEASKDEADRFEEEPSPELGTPTKFYERDGVINLHPRPSLDCTLIIYGYLQHHIDNADDVLPWQGRFNECIRADVVKRAHNLLQHFRYTIKDEQALKAEVSKIKRRALGRNRLQFRPRQGWN